jgi:hypothetical protein
MRFPPPRRLSSNFILPFFILLLVYFIISQRFLETTHMARGLRPNPFTGPDLFHPSPRGENETVELRSNASAQSPEEKTVGNTIDNFPSPALEIQLSLDQLRLDLDQLRNDTTGRGLGALFPRGGPVQDPVLTATPSGRGAEEKAKTNCEEYSYICEECDPWVMRKVIAVSLYGNNPRSFVYYKHLISIAAQVKKLFGREWVLRVYTDSPANVSTLLKGVQIVDMGHLECVRPPNPMMWR